MKQQYSAEAEQQYLEEHGDTQQDMHAFRAPYAQHQEDELNNYLATLEFAAANHVNAVYDRDSEAIWDWSVGQSGGTGRWRRSVSTKFRLLSLIFTEEEADAFRETLVKRGDTFFGWTWAEWWDRSVEVGDYTPEQRASIERETLDRKEQHLGE